MNVILHCKFDQISINAMMPEHSEVSYRSFVKVGRYPVLTLNISIGS